MSGWRAGGGAGRQRLSGSWTITASRRSTRRRRASAPWGAPRARTFSTNESKNDNGDLKLAYVFDPADGAWRAPTPAPHPRFDAAAAFIGNRFHGSRTSDTDTALLNESVRALSTLLTRIPLDVDHGPIGIGIEIMTYIADHYRPRGLGSVVGVFGRSNVVCHADCILVLGGGHGTLDEIDLAISMRKPLVPFAASGGTAGLSYDRMQVDEALRTHLSPEEFRTLGECGALQYARIVESVVVSPRWRSL